MGSGPGQSHSLPPWLQVDGQQAEINDSHEAAPTPIERPRHSKDLPTPQSRVQATEIPPAAPITRPSAAEPQQVTPPPEQTPVVETQQEAKPQISHEQLEQQAPAPRQEPKPKPQAKPEPAPQAKPQQPEPAPQPTAQPEAPVASTTSDASQASAPAAADPSVPPLYNSGQYMAPPAALDQSILVNPVKPAPRTGWRKFVHTMTAGHVNLGDSEKVAKHQRLVDLVRSPLKGDYRIAVLSLKGGVGKTTTSVMLGGIFASLRGDRVIAIDANPDLGTLAQRAALPGSPTIRDLLRAQDVTKYSNIRMYTTQAESRLEVIGSDRDPEVSEAFSEDDYRHAIDILQHHYNVILTDCGTGLMHSAMAGVLDLANTLILVTSPALDGAQSASATLDWLNHHGYGQLVSNAIVVVSSSHPGNATIDVKQLMEHFKARTRAVQLIPFDRHLSEGAIIDLERLDKKTYMAYLELAGLVAQDFTNWHRHAE